ncbi:tumor necrosis factor ligand superfamily member 9 [Hyperolius riggenbachi]|uniref:tumor necrosis factor ligand superfamily member 9 n=1 Tax=Hyperolius riggenbachi TaxID=752182 RepID=UPI0035A36A06
MNTSSPLPVTSSGDPEKQGSSPRTCRCIDYCLVTSLVLLTMVVGALGVFYMALERPHWEDRTSALIQGLQKQQQLSSAHLIMHNGHLKNGDVVVWAEDGEHGTFIGKDFKLSGEPPKELLVEKTGRYYIYCQVDLKCVDKDACTEGKHVSFSVEKNIEKRPLLKLNVHAHKLRQASSFSAGNVNLEKGDRIRVVIETTHEISDWQLDGSNSSMGLVWISNSFEVTKDQ